jgi:urease accessory protein
VFRRSNPDLSSDERSDPVTIASPPRTDHRLVPGGTVEDWEARLELGFARDGARTAMVARRHVGPLRVQKPLYPEGGDPCQVIVVHPPGGVVGGDSLAVDIAAGPGTHVQVTTPGAAKWYRSASREARSSTGVRVEPGALVEWLPQETMLFDGARAAIAVDVRLRGDARFIGWDVTCLGRTASGERFDSGCLRQRLVLHRDDELVWCERTVLDGGSRALQSGAVLAGAPAFGTLIAAFGPVSDAVLAACRDVRCASGVGAVTRLPQVLVARYRGESPGAARTYLASLWRLLRPEVAGRAAVMPRIWLT